MERIKFIDGDSHVLEPPSLWEHYLEKQYQPLIKGFCRWDGLSEAERAQLSPDQIGSTDPLVFRLELEVMGRRLPMSRDREGPTQQGQGRVLTDLSRAYEKWADQDFPASAYRHLMDNHGIDYMILYPTVGFWTTSVPEMDAATAMALRRAYNRWLGDYVKEIGPGACHAVSIDLRDPAAAAAEVRRCVKEYDSKAVHLNPAPVPGRRVFDEACDVLWATCAELGVPIGLHPSAENPLDQGLLDYLPGLRNCRTTVSFCIGSMLACTAFIMGGVLERHPKLKVVFLESGCGWAAFWPERLESGIQGGTRRLKILGLNRSPVQYFQDQCFVAAEADDPGIKDVIAAIGDHVLLASTDFGHPEGRKYATAVQSVMELPEVSLESKRKLLWDNGLRAYPINPK